MSDTQSFAEIIRPSPDAWNRPASTTTATRSVGHDPGEDTARGLAGRSAEERAEAAERRVAALERALASRATIDQAKGLLMGVFGLEADAAFERLVWVSQHANVKLNVIAERFLHEARRVPFGGTTSERLTRILARLARDPAAVDAQ